MTIKKTSIYFFCFLFILTGSVSFVPGSNGDLPFYIAAARAVEGKTDAQALREAGQIILTEQSGWKAQVHIERIKHADANILEYYRIKPIYVTMIRLLHALGLSYLNATLVPSLCSFIFMGILVFLWSNRLFSPLPALLVSIVIMLTGPLLILARLSTPDPISNLFLLFALYRIYYGRGNMVTATTLIASLAVRLDNLIAVLLLLMFMSYRPDRTKRLPQTAFFLFSGIAILSVVCINYFYSSSAWWFLKDSHQQAFGYLQSARAYFHQILIYALFLSESSLLVLVLFGLIAFQRKSVSGEQAAMLKVISLIILLRFLIFPNFEVRFFSAYYVAAIFILAEAQISPGTNGSCKAKGSECA